MKTILYISRSNEKQSGSKLPDSLASIIVNSRRKNRVLGLRSVLCFHNGCYMQIIEGEDVFVDNLMNAVKKDSRHEAINILVDKNIRQTSLENDNFKLMLGSDRNSGFIQYVNKHLSKKYSSNATNGNVIDDLLSSANSIESDFSTYESSVLSMSVWPSFDKIEPTRELLELCAILTTTKSSFSSLVGRGIFSSKAELAKMLDNLSALKILDSEVVSNPVQLNSMQVADSFFKKMRSFIKGVSV